MTIEIITTPEDVKEQIQDYINQNEADSYYLGLGEALDTLELEESDADRNGNIGECPSVWWLDVHLIANGKWILDPDSNQSAQVITESRRFAIYQPISFTNIHKYLDEPQVTNPKLIKGYENSDPARRGE